MSFRETFINNSIEHFSDVGLDICTKWWVIPQDIAASSPLILLGVGCDSWWFRKYDVIVIASSTKGIIVDRGSISKFSMGR